MIKRRLTSHYKILLAIVSNPHSDNPEALWNTFEKDFNSTIPSYKLDPNASLDKAGFEQLKFAMADNPKIIIKS